MINVLKPNNMNTLFLVDDNKVDHFIMQSVLRQNPLFDSVKRFDSGESIINYLSENKAFNADLPDVIFLDLSMPQFDGWDVLESLNSFYGSLVKKIKVYIISASINKQDINKAFTYPFVSNFFSKPITNSNFSIIAADIQTYNLD